MPHASNRARDWHKTPDFCESTRMCCRRVALHPVELSAEERTFYEGILKGFGPLLEVRQACPSRCLPRDSAAAS